MAFNVKFYQGTQEAYDALETKEPQSFYLVDNGNLYLGALKLSNDAEVKEILLQLSQNAIIVEDLRKQVAEIKAGLQGGGEGGSGSGSTGSGDISELEEAIENLQIAIGTHNEQFDEYKASMQLMYSTLDDKVTIFGKTLSQLDTTMKQNKVELETNITNLNTLLTGAQADIGALAEKQNEHDIKINTLTSQNGVALSQLSSVDTKVNILIGEDSQLSVRQIAGLEVAKIVAEADEKFDTLKEIADWIINDTAGVSGINIRIAASEKEISQLKQNIASLETRIKANEDAIAEINNGTSGILVIAKAYADSAANSAQSKAESTAAQALQNHKAENDAAFSQMNSAIEALQKAIIDGGGSGSGGGTSADIIEDMIDSAIIQLELGTASKADVEDFDAAGSASAALTQAKAYSDANKTEVLTYIDSALAWGHIPTGF